MKCKYETGTKFFIYVQSIAVRSLVQAILKVNRVSTIKTLFGQIKKSWYSFGTAEHTQGQKCGYYWQWMVHKFS